MSTIGANAQPIPAARASRAATAWPCSIASGSHDAAIAIGTGKIVRRPWITSNPNTTGMPCRLPATASRWSRFTSAGSVTSNSEPTSPLASAASTAAAWPGMATTGASGSWSSPDGSEPK